MLGTAPPIAFIGVSNLDRAKAFYCDTLGLGFVSESSFALELDAAGTMLRVTKVDAVRPAPYTALGWRVADIQKTVHALTTRGASFQRYDGMDQDEAGVWTSPGGARVAWFKDPDGNTLSLTEFPPG